MSFGLRTLLTIGECAALIAFVWWQMRGDRKEFRVLRVLIVTFLAASGSLPFVAAFWWLTPKDPDWRNNPWLLAAMFVPLFALSAWGLIHFGRKLRQIKHTE
jgi:hypothetical protein